MQEKKSFELSGALGCCAEDMQGVYTREAGDELVYTHAKLKSSLYYLKSQWVIVPTQKSSWHNKVKFFAATMSAESQPELAIE